jgi:hypothetical protein
MTVSILLLQVLDLKQKVEDENGKDKFPVKDMKLIYAGNLKLYMYN